MSGIKNLLILALAGASLLPALASAGSREAPARARISRFLMPDILKSPYEKVDGR